jgi:hypothetical protein
MVYRKLRNLAFWCFWALIVGIIFRPAISSPPVGDDLINPFYQFFYTGGSFTRALHLGYQYGTSHKFDIVGQTIFVIHSWMWLQFDHLAHLNHMWFYYLTKWANFCLVLISITYWITSSLSITRKSAEFKRLLLLASVVGGATIQLHNIWSNDPVGNYPLSGFAAAACGFFTLGMLSKCIRSPSTKIFAISSGLVGLCILYYEINIALIFSLLVVWLMTSRQAILQRRYFRCLLDGFSLSFIPLLVVLYGRIVTAGKTAEYGGTTIGRWSQFPKTSLVAFIGNLPGGAWTLSKRFISTLNFPNVLVLGTVFIVILLTGYLIAKLGSDHSVGDVSIKHTTCLLIPGFVYWLASIALQTMTDKYQNEIVEIGQTYNFYAQGFMFITGSIVVGLLITARRKSLLPLIAAFLVTFSCIQYQINTQLVQALRIGNGASIGLINSYDPDATDTARCAAWRAWASGAWPEYYEQGMAVGLRAGFKSFYGQDFCDSGIAPIP